MARHYSPLVGRRAFDTSIRDASSRYRSEHFMLFVSPARDRARLGMIIARKNLASAVQRNRLKRVIRSRCELMIDQEAASLNLVFLLRRKVSDIRQLQLEKEIEGLLARIKSA